jgi:hypothetical protein
VIFTSNLLALPGEGEQEQGRICRIWDGGLPLLEPTTACQKRNHRGSNIQQRIALNIVTAIQFFGWAVFARILFLFKLNSKHYFYCITIVQTV